MIIERSREPARLALWIAVCALSAIGLSAFVLLEQAFSLGF